MGDTKLKPYVCTYRYDGSEWGVTVWAANPDDAKGRLNRMQWATVDGELMATFSWEWSWIPKLMVWAKQAFGRQ